MPRFFLEVAYKGTAYSGFQKQDNAITVQSEVENALFVLYRKSVELTTSSRTDAGVHALQNFFHFDADIVIDEQQTLYRLNAILSRDIVIKKITQISDEAHSRFDAVSRSYEYRIHQKKAPFLTDRSFHYPYQLNVDDLNKAASLLFSYQDYTSFSKRNTQVKTFLCDIQKAEWKWIHEELIFFVTANRFLRGMVRGLTGTMLKVGRGILSIDDFAKIIEAKDCSKADFSVPPHGLFLIQVSYPETIWKQWEES